MLFEQGVQLAKRLQSVHSAAERGAELAAYFGDLGSAQSLYLSAGRPDLALQMHAGQGNWAMVTAPSSQKLLRRYCSAETQQHAVQVRHSKQTQAGKHPGCLLMYLLFLGILHGSMKERCFPAELGRCVEWYASPPHEGQGFSTTRTQAHTAVPQRSGTH